MEKMSTDAIMEYISECSRIRRLEFQVSIQCAQVLKGIKASNLITLAKGALEEVRRALLGTEITVALMAVNERTEVLLLYRYPMLSALLDKEEIQEFLRAHGYTQSDTASVLLGLRRRYTAYLAGEGEFPHELGVLLEYPVEDVKDFIRCKGEEYLFTGYWKVYHNPAKAKARFCQFDRAREFAMQQVIDGRPLSEVAVKTEKENRI